jgi:hypothetical protein
MRVLLSLVGEQPTPNLIPLYHAANVGQRFDGVKFLASSEERIREVARHLSEAITKEMPKADSPLSGMKIIDSGPPIEAWQLDKAREDCENSINKCLTGGHEVIVNLTGGTKIMSLAAYRAAVNTGVPMLYVNTAETQVQHYDPSGEPTKAERFHVKIPIETQLRAAGREFSARPKEPTLGATAIAPERRTLVKWMVDNFTMAVQECVMPVTKFINQALSRSENCGVAYAAPYRAPLSPRLEAARRAAQHLSEAGFWDWDGNDVLVAKDRWDFVNGRWLEAYAVTTLAERIADGWFDEVLGPVYVQGSPEIDAMISKNGQLVILECKLTGGDLTSILGKLYAHEHLLSGLYGASIFVRAAPENRQGATQWAQYKVETVIGPDLKNLARSVKDKFRV